MTDREKLIAAIVKLLQKADVETLRFVYFFLLH